MGTNSYTSLLKEKIKETSDLLEDKAQIKNYEDYCFQLGRLISFKECLEMWRNRINDRDAELS